MSAARLYYAAKDGDLATVQVLLAVSSVDVHEPGGSYGWTPLYIASRKGQAAVVAALLATPGIDVNKENKNGRTPLYVAAWKGQTAVVAALLATPGIDVNKEDKDGATPLHRAAENGHSETMQLLVTFGADMSAENVDGKTPEQCATRRGQDEVALWLRAVATWHPIRIAVACRHHGAARLMLRNGTCSDPTTCSIAEINKAATGTALWPGLPTPPVCTTTRMLARAAMACWSPTRHWLYHRVFRDAVHTVLLVEQRLLPDQNDSPTNLTVLPTELWLHVCAWLLRRHWME
jgi:hypothetical protein